ncbi:MAG: alpha/beta hydrolase [Alkalibacterium sp.]|nr:alpha/beta hydrolase [Alkalibacterium sp.]
MTKNLIYGNFNYMKFLTLPASPAVIPFVNTTLSLLRKLTPTKNTLSEKTIRLTSYDDELITLTLYQPKTIEKPEKCLLYFYGSAYFIKQAPHHKKWAMTYAEETSALVIVVDYRLAPKHPFPTPFWDCFEASEWLFSNASRLGLDPNKLVVGGDSSGGALAASVTMMRRDRGLPNFASQFLIYPVTDARMQTPSMEEFHSTPVWSRRLNEMMWSLYMQEKPGMDWKYAAPLEEVSYDSLPPAYVEVCEIDPLRDEGLLLADALHQSGHSVDVAFVPKALHGYDMAFNSHLAQAFKERRLAVLRRAFGEV